jgi:hypothetical protein
MGDVITAFWNGNAKSSVRNDGSYRPASMDFQKRFKGDAPVQAQGMEQPAVSRPAVSTSSLSSTSH